MSQPKFKTALQTAYLKQQNLELTQENIEDCGLQWDGMELLKETDTAYIIHYTANESMFMAEFLNVVFKNSGEMETIDL